MNKSKVDVEMVKEMYERTISSYVEAMEKLSKYYFGELELSFEEYDVLAGQINYLHKSLGLIAELTYFELFYFDDARYTAVSEMYDESIKVYMQRKDEELKASDQEPEAAASDPEEPETDEVDPEVLPFWEQDFEITVPDEFIVQGNYGGYYDDDGHFVVCEEYGLSDADTDRYAIEVQNGDGYYSSEDGHFIRFA